MNEYTRREEIRWTLATVVILVPAVAVAIVKLVLAQGPMVTDPSAFKMEVEAQQLHASFKPCPTAARDLKAELGIFKKRAEAAKRQAKARADKKRGRRGKTEKLVVKLPWSAAAPVQRHARVLHESNCESATIASVGARSSAAPAWKAVRKAGALKDPGNSKSKQQKVAKTLLSLFEKAPLDKIQSHTADAKKQLTANLDKASKTRATAKVRAPLPEGLFPRGAAIGVGVGVSLAALIISYISVRSASSRRGSTLLALRRFANTPEAGLQAAAIVRLAAHHNGGEPGMVVGSAIGGLIAAVIAPTSDPNTFIADLFVAGSMGGLLIGLAFQWLVRTAGGLKSWRERTKELGDIEKPTIPVALVLGGVTPGLEKQFMRYFEALPMADAAMVVEKLAAQAEEQILAAADAGQQAAAAGWGGMPPQQGGMPPQGF